MFFVKIFGFFLCFVFLFSENLYLTDHAVLENSQGSSPWEDTKDTNKVSFFFVFQYLICVHGARYAENR